MTTPIYDLIIRRAHVIDAALRQDGVADIAIKGDHVAAVGDLTDLAAHGSIDGSGLYASAGWVDLHAHVFGGSVRGVDADQHAGVNAGVTTVVDAGSSGAGTWEAFRDYVIDRSVTRVLAFLNISLLPSSGPRHGDWRNLNQQQTIPLAERELAAGRCVGIKALASRTHCGDLDLIPVKLARQAARLSGARLMVHIGNAPPLIDEVLELLGPGDIVTHCWHGKPGGLFDRHGQPLPETRAAVARGVKFDLGHGRESFSFNAARLALAAGLPLHTISTDLHRGNLKGPVHDQATTMAKFLHLGFSLAEVIRLSTVSPAALIGREREFGSLVPGRCADVTLFRAIDGDFVVTDSEGRAETATRRLEPVITVRAGKVVWQAQ